MGLLKKCLHWYIPLPWRGGRRSLTGWLWWFCTRQLPPTVHDSTFSTVPHALPKVPFRTNRTAARHQIMVTVNEMDRMDCLYRHNALGRIIKMPIDLLAQSAALFCPYTYNLYCGSA